MDSEGAYLISKGRSTNKTAKMYECIIKRIKQRAEITGTTSILFSKMYPHIAQLLEDDGFVLECLIEGYVKVSWDKN